MSLKVHAKNFIKLRKLKLKDFTPQRNSVTHSLKNGAYLKIGCEFNSSLLKIES